LKKLLFLILSFYFSFIFSQDYDKQYSNEDVITTYLSRHIKISSKRDKLSITEEVQKDNFFISNNGLSFAKESVSYNTFNTIKSITANTFNNNIASVVTMCL
jgi:hypothetical protein